MAPLEPYLSPEQREATLDRLAQQAGGVLVRYGESVEGRPLRAVRLARPEGRARRVLCTAGIHGPELVGCHLALELLRAAGQGDPAVARLLDRADLWLVPCVNPDGYARTWQRGGAGALRELRPNAQGVDLNRNWPPPLGQHTVDLPWAGSSTPGSVTYRGTAPLSEPETAWLNQLLLEQCFHASINLHSFMGTVIPARVRQRAPYATYGALARSFAAAQRRWRYRRLSSRLFDVYTGELEDHQHHNLGCWASCVELMSVVQSYRQHLRAPSLFWRFNPRDPRPWVENDLPAVVAWLQAALELPPPGPMVIAAEQS